MTKELMKYADSNIIKAMVAFDEEWIWDQCVIPLRQHLRGRFPELKFSSEQYRRCEALVAATEGGCRHA